MRRAYSYIRFSSQAQAKGDSLRRQTEFTERYCKKHGLVLDDTLHLQDLGISAFHGTNVQEGALAGFVEACRLGRVPSGSTLIIESLDRLSRNQVRLALRFFMDLLDLGVSIVTFQPEREYTPENADPLALIEPLLVFARAHEESLTKSHRVHEAWNQKRKKAAEKPMTGKCPAWLRLTPKGFEEVKPAADAVRRIFTLCVEGLGVHRIVAQLQKEEVKPFGQTQRWNMSYVRKILTWSAVMGELQPYVLKDGKRVPHGEPLPGYYPAVVSDTDFYAAQQMLKGRRNKQGRAGHMDANLFTGLVYHACDKTTMVLKRPTGGEQKYLYLISSAYLLGRKSVGIRSFPYLPFEQAVLKFLTELRSTDVTDQRRPAGGLEEEIAKLSVEIEAIDRQLERVNARARKDGDVEPYLDLIRGLGDDKREKVERRERLKVQAAVDQAQSLDDAQSLVAMLAAAEGQELETLRRRIKGRVLTLVKEIWVLVEKKGRRRVLFAQVYLHSGVVRNITVYHPALRPDEPRPQVRALDDVDLRSYAATPEG